MLLERSTYLLAVCVALGINLLVILFLKHFSFHNNAAQKKQATSLQIVWIERPVIQKIQDNFSYPNTKATGKQKHVVKFNTPLAIPLSTSSNAIPANHTAEIVSSVTASDDDWSRSAPVKSAELKSLSFASDVFKRTDYLPESTIQPMNLTFNDNSLTGKLQRLSKANDCRELAAALRTSPESAATILASMKHRGCDGG